MNMIANLLDIEKCMVFNTMDAKFLQIIQS